ncbi:MAG: phenylalanine 4-monooxygenase [Luteibacter sp.]|uniref:phenylalanine 4-monooxygenase n=1 Tax=Luteibacter TaxID=242605 RepID=UPI00056B6849|nr:MULTISPECIES: phenylalanine 4-monooxygenase [unclassified Luteibacter]MDQ7995839.1 phenylalanine 4-monooxygenase [Luteibacter sp.]MDQ8049127.1 phenylalanine 4-monooxygenase [Luteibacter sp.]MDR6642366.1 phenylalanine-4-hydroxylase [Luteibacter sp. 1214]
MESPRRVEHQQTDRGYVPVYATGIVEQPWASYSKTDHEVWDTLYRRQRDLLPAYACQEFLDGVERFGFGEGGIPRFEDLNKVLGEATGWEIVAVEGLLPDEVFFDHLANRRFPVSWWIRRPDQLDYLSEPDLFHDLFGHVPLLLNPVFADYMQAYGKGGMKAYAIGPEALMNLTRLYWYTVEFGLIRTDAGLRIYGAGIVSSKGESIYSIDSASPNRVGFDLERVMNTRYRIDSYQQTYFVIDDFAQLFEATGPDFTPIYARLADGTAVAASDVVPADKIFNIGTREGFVSGGDN